MQLMYHTWHYSRITHLIDSGAFHLHRLVYVLHFASKGGVVLSRISALTVRLLVSSREPVPLLPAGLIAQYLHTYLPTYLHMYIHIYILACFAFLAAQTMCVGRYLFTYRDTYICSSSMYDTTSCTYIYLQ